MPATIIDHHIVTDAIADGPWTEAMLDQPLGTGDVPVAIPLNPSNPQLANNQQPPATYDPKPPANLLPPTSVSDFVTTSGAQYEMKQYPNLARVSLRLNSNEGGGYAIAVRNGTTYSTPELRGTPRIRGLWRSTVEQGSWFLVWGDNLHGDANRSGIFIVDPVAKTWSELPQYGGFELHPGYIDGRRVKAVLVPATLAAGNYLIAAHNGVGAQFGWSGTRQITVTAPLTVPSDSRTVTPGTAASLISSAIAQLDAGGGGTLKWTAGEYVLNNSVILKPNIRHVTTGGPVVIKKAITAANTPLFVLADNNSFDDGFTFRGNPSATPPDNWVFALPSPAGGVTGKNLRINRCTFEDCVLNNGSAPGAFYEACKFVRASSVYAGPDTLYWRCEFLRGIYTHPWYSIGSRDTAVVSCLFDGTDRGAIGSPAYGSVAGVLFFGNTFRDIGKVFNGGEIASADGAFYNETVSVTVQNPTTYRVRGTPSTSLMAKATHAFFRYTAKTGEAIEVVSVTTGTDAQGAYYDLGLARPRKSALAVTSVELFWGYIDNLWIKTRVYGGRGPGVLQFYTFCHGNVYEDWYGEDSAGVLMYANPNNAALTQQQNFITRSEFRHPPSYPASSAEAGGCFLMTTSAHYNTFANVTVVEPENSEMQQFDPNDDSDLRMERPPIVFRSYGDGNLVSRSFAFGGREYVPHKGMLTRNYVTDYLRARTVNATPTVLTLDGDPTSVNYPGNRLKVAPAGETVTYELTLTARQSIATGSKHFFRRFTVQRVGTITSLVGVASEDVGSPTWSVAVTADSLGPVVTVTGASITIDWVGRLRVVNRVA